LKRLVLASGNPDKLRELRDLLSPLEIEVVAAGEIVEGWDVEETGITLEENALLKARTASASAGLPAVADDTGLFVHGLGGAPGIYTARYAGRNSTYGENVRKLLRALTGEVGEARRAVFRTAAALVLPGNGEFCVVGEITGYISEEPSGKGGFGYDPVFFASELGMTFAEAPLERKNEVSHRARAIRALHAIILEELASVPDYPEAQ
jgi:XTP/dITP diphosphohydrolase